MKVLRWGAFIGITCALVIYWIVTERAPVTTRSASVTEATEPHSQNAASFPPLRFSSSGRLPTKLQGFQLGMSLPDALSIDPTLENFDGTKSSANKLNAALVSKRNGFFTELSFSTGRLLHIQSGAGSISPADGQQFDASTIAQLGPPDFAVYKGPESKRLVWTDGDVRIAYANRSCDAFGPRGGRCAELEMAIYPPWISHLQNSSDQDKLMSRGVLVSSVRRDWERGARPSVLKELPVSLSGLRLGMAPFQVRAVVPGIEISSLSEKESKGSATSGSFRYDVDFWNNHACSFCRTISDFPAARFGAISEKQYAILGTPASELLGSQSEYFEWEDSRTIITMLMATSSNAQGSSIEQCMRDRRLDDLKESAHESKPPQYKSSPETKSFF